MFAKKDNRGRVAVLELAREHVAISVLDRRDGKSRLRTKRQPWSQEGAAVFATIDPTAVATMVREMMPDEKFAGVPVHVVISGDFCVTRTIAGTREHVERELRELRDRCGLYISLGHGRKSFAESFRTIDAKRAQGSMTITNEQTLAAATEAAGELGLKVKSIEHSLVALSRAVGRTGQDAELPVIVVELNQRGIDLGISFQGRLLLDYRPGGLTRMPGEQRQLASIILKHLGRIRRYCHRYFQYSGGKLDKVFLSGQGEEVEVLKRHLEESTDLRGVILEPDQVYGDWAFEGVDGADSWLLPTLGALVPEEQSGTLEDTPDLLKPLLLSRRQPLGPALIRYGWPIAAVFVLALLSYGGGWYHRWQSSKVMAAVEKARTDAEILASRQVELRAIEAKTKSLGLIGERLVPPDWDILLADIGSCFPQGTWLESLKVDRTGTVYLFGPSFLEPNVYELVEGLKNVPSLSDVVLEGTRSARLDSGPATLFDVKCMLRNSAENVEKVQ